MLLITKDCVSPYKKTHSQIDSLLGDKSECGTIVGWCWVVPWFIWPSGTGAAGHFICVMLG